MPGTQFYFCNCYCYVNVDLLYPIVEVVPGPSDLTPTSQSAVMSTPIRFRTGRRDYGHLTAPERGSPSSGHRGAPGRDSPAGRSSSRSPNPPPSPEPPPSDSASEQVTFVFY